MPGKNAPEFSYDPKTKLYRKRVKNEATGKWTPVYGKTKTELRKKIKEKEKEFAAQIVAENNPFVYEYAAKWYRLHTGDLGQKRKDDYKNAINNHICPVIGSLPMRAVTYDHIREVMAAASGMSSSAQQKIVVTLKRIFSAAEKSDIIDRSPCADLRAGGKPAEEKIPLTKDQQRRLVAAMKGTKAYPFIMLCLYAGLRREEALGLQWDCVHLDAVPYISVRRAVRWDGKNQPIVGEKLKSDAASRDIPIPECLAECLREEKSKSAGAFVIGNSKGEAMSAASFRKLWDSVGVRTVRPVTRVDKDGKPVTEELELGYVIPRHNITISLDFHVTPHQLRHTYITELILAETPIKTVQYLAGHATVALTLNIYTHLMENKPADIMKYVTNTFGANNGAKPAAEAPQALSQQ